MSEHEDTVNQLVIHYQKGRTEALDEVLEILKKNPMFPVIVSQKLYLKIKELRDSQNDNSTEGKQ